VSVSLVELAQGNHAGECIIIVSAYLPMYLKNPDDVCTILLLRVTYIILIHKCS